MSSSTLLSPSELGFPAKFAAWRENQIRAIDRTVLAETRFVAAVAPTGTGKCFGKGTPILMYSGETKAVEDVRVGDRLMGPDSEARVVTSLSRGHDCLYRVTPTKGDPYVVNGAHILCLKMTETKKYVNLSVEDYLTKSRYFKHCAKGYRVGVVFPFADLLPVDPYFVGLWLGDGDSTLPSVTTADLEILDWLVAYADTIGLHVRVQATPRACVQVHLHSGARARPNKLKGQLRALGLLKNKHIPHNYLTASIDDRCRLLAGLIDTDGYQGDSCFDFISSIERLARETAFLARSLGLAAYVLPCRKKDQHGTEGDYWRVSISGTTDMIPVRVPRKAAPARRQKKDVLVTGLSVEAIGVGEYFGFALDGPDRRFLLGDFTVAHNSLYGVACAKLIPGVSRAVYLTSTRGLQDQMAVDFDAMGLFDIRGQQNYPCVALEPGNRLHRYRRHKGYAGCDEGPCHVGVRCDHAPDPKEPRLRPYCQYYGRVWDAQGADLVSTNYAYWLSSAAYSQGLGQFDLLILDEAHHAIDELERFLTFELGPEDAGRLRSRLIDDENPMPWQSWGAYHWRELSSQLEDRSSHPPRDPEEAMEIKRLKLLLSRLDRLRGIRSAEWVVERDHHRVRFSPINVAQYAEEYLFQRIPHVILMSATMTPKTLTMLGIPETASTVLSFPSSFPVERRPVIAVETTPGVTVNHKMDETARYLWLRRIDRLLDARTDRKGIIHTVSYARAKELVKESAHKDRMIFHDSSTTNLAVKAFKEHLDPVILVSPSIVTGYDFPGDQCRFQIIGKVPMPDTRGKIMEIRCAMDPDYPYYLAMQKLVQACGRGMRAEDDWCETLIVDDGFGGWFARYENGNPGRAAKFAPQWFLDAIRYVDLSPEPLSLVA